MITSGDPIGAQEALDGGLIDEIVDGRSARRRRSRSPSAWLAEGRPLSAVRDRNDS